MNELNGLPEVGGVNDINMVKRGESCISMTFRRSMGGLTLSVKTHPAIEEFFRNISTGEQVDVRSLGRHWVGITKDTQLMAYNLAEPIPIIQLDASRRARFDWLARQLLTPTGSGAPPGDGLLHAADTPRSGGLDVNLAFLRLVGIGDGAGITFSVKGVYSESAMQSLRDNIAEAGKRFYQIYMKPVNLNVAIVTQEW